MLTGKFEAFILMTNSFWQTALVQVKVSYDWVKHSIYWLSENLKNSLRTMAEGENACRHDECKSFIEWVNWCWCKVKHVCICIVICWCIHCFACRVKQLICLQLGPVNLKSYRTFYLSHECANKNTNKRRERKVWYEHVFSQAFQFNRHHYIYFRCMNKYV